ncbi:F-box and WD repeat domain-containing 11-A-like [Daphnia pulex]|uniref:F-box and WD repeat domain-containing 11-A-like n=1 Tax=Daphnia pulex TaxID=6669 RepID=UPI001EDE4E42|nr:F-box and WD repeat domain-containing 11-A-like [Daphnia pulex]
MESNILSSLKGGYPHLTEKILNLLDARSLANAELVCRQWRSFIADGRCWKKYLLSKKVTSIPNIFSWAEYSGDNESERHHTKQDWIKIHNFYQKLEDNWRSASCRQQKIVDHQVKYFSMNTKKIFTASYMGSHCVLQTWNRKSLHCERNFTDGDKHKIVSMDCDDDFLVTMSIAWFNRPGIPCVSTILVRELQSGEVIQRIMGNYSRSCGYETSFKICVGHGLLISHQVVGEQPNGRLILQDVLKSRLDLWRMANVREIEAKSTVCLVPISKLNVLYPVCIGHDENYIVVHRSDPPRFEIISTSSLNLTRTIDAFDYCLSVHYKDGLIVSSSDHMDTHTRTCCIIRIWDAETGLCLREIQEPEPERYSNLNHLVGFTTNYLITVPADLSMLKGVIKIQDLSVAIDLHSNQTSASTVVATLELDWSNSWFDRFIVDDFQLVYFHDQELVVHSFAPEV